MRRGSFNRSGMSASSAQLETSFTFRPRPSTRTKPHLPPTAFDCQPTLW